MCILYYYIYFYFIQLFIIFHLSPTFINYIFLYTYTKLIWIILSSPYILFENTDQLRGVWKKRWNIDNVRFSKEEQATLKRYFNDLPKKHISLPL